MNSNSNINLVVVFNRKVVFNSNNSINLVVVSNRIAVLNSNSITFSIVSFNRIVVLNRKSNINLAAVFKATDPDRVHAGAAC